MQTQKPKVRSHLTPLRDDSSAVKALRKICRRFYEFEAGKATDEIGELQPMDQIARGIDPKMTRSATHLQMNSTKPEADAINMR